MILNLLPEEVEEICRKLKSPPRLIAHLTLVHDVAVKILDKFQEKFPSLKIEREMVLFGAAIHDIGKTVYPDELVNAGNRHEDIGITLLESFGIPKEKARFTYTHANWATESNIEIEDLLVALADNCWKGKRNEKLENLITTILAQKTGIENWEIFLTLDEILHYKTHPQGIGSPFPYASHQHFGNFPKCRVLILAGFCSL